jgi:hypothetical protein
MKHKQITSKYLTFVLEVTEISDVSCSFPKVSRSLFSLAFLKYNFNLGLKCAKLNLGSEVHHRMELIQTLQSGIGAE